MIAGMKIKIKVFYKHLILFLLVIARHAESTQNRKFVISLQYLRKEKRDEVNFCMQININLFHK